MEQSEEIYRAVFSTLGGRLRRDRADKWWELERGDLLLELELGWRYLGSRFCLELGCAVSHKKLSIIAARIQGEPPATPQTYKYDQRFLEVDSLAGAEMGYRKIIEEEVERLGKTEIDQVVKEFAKACPDQPYMRQIMHLASLAWLGDFNALMDYQRIFERGYRMNFVPKIDKTMIERALDIALERT